MFQAESGVYELNASLYPDHTMPLPGFAGAWARGVVTGITLLSRQRYLFQVYRYESEAVRWLGKLLVHKSGLSIDIEAGGRAIEAFRQHYAKHLGIREA